MQKRLFSFFLGAAVFSLLFASGAVSALTLQNLEPEYATDSKIEFNTPEEGYSFDVTFLAQNQNLTYKTTITNNEEDPIAITQIDLQASNYNFLNYSFEGITVNDELEPNESREITLKIASNSNATRSIAEDFKLSIHYHKTTDDPIVIPNTGDDPINVPDTGTNTANQSSATNNNQTIFFIITSIASIILLVILLSNKKVKNLHAIVAVLSLAATFFIVGNTVLAEKDKDLTITGKVRFTNIYSISINPGAGKYQGETGVKTIECRDGERIVIDDPTYDTFNFTGWTTTPQTTFTTDDQGHRILIADNNYELSAEWDEIFYNLTIDPNGGTYNGQVGVQVLPIRVGTSTTLVEPVKEGATFINWTKTINGTSEIITDMSIIIEEDVTLTANYEDIYFDVVINPNGGIYKNSTATVTEHVKYGTELSIPNPTYDTYNFTGWNITPSVTMTGEVLTVKNNYTLVAEWEEIYYTLTINPDGGTYKSSTEVQEEYYRAGTTASISAPEKEGFNFTNWTKQIGSDSETFTGTSLVMNSNVNLIANYEDKYFNVTINPNGGKFNDSTEIYSARVKYGTNIDLGNHERENYYLVNWTMNTNDYLPAATQNIQVYSDLELVANWAIITYYTVTINPNGGIYNETTEPTILSNVLENSTLNLGEATYTGYALEYWEVTSGTVNTASEGRLTENNFTVVDDVVLTAHWGRRVARIERTQVIYGSIMAAEGAAEENDIITLLVDTEETVTNEKKVTLDLNNHKITGSLTNENIGDITIINGEINNPAGAAVINNGTLTIGVNDYKDDGTANIINDNVRLVGTTAGLMQTNNTYKFYYYDGYLEGASGLVGGYDGSPSYRNAFDGVVVHYYPFVNHVEQNGNNYQHVELESSDRAVSKTSVHGDIYYYNLQDNVNTSAQTGYKIYAVRDFTASYTINVASGDDITIDLAGYNLNMMDTITVDGILRIEDSTSTPNDNSETTFGGSMNVAKKIVINNELILNNTLITGEEIMQNNSKLTMLGSTLNSTSGYVFRPVSGSTMNLDDTSFIKGGVYNTTTDFNWTSGNLVGYIKNSGDSAVTTISGGVLLANIEWTSTPFSSGTFNIEGGLIKNNNTTNCSEYYSCILLQANINMTGGTIEAAATAIRVTRGEHVNIRGGKIVSKAAIRFDKGSYPETSLTIGTNDDTVSNTSPEIIGTTYAIQSDYGFAMYDGVLKGGVAVLADENRDPEINNRIIVPENTNYHIESSDEYQEIFWAEPEVIPFLSVDGNEYNSFTEAYNAITGDTGLITVTHDREIKSAIPESPLNKTITIDLNNHKLQTVQTLANNGNMTIVDNGGGSGEIRNINRGKDSSVNPTILNNNTLTIQSGTIASNRYKYAIETSRSSVLNIEGGKVEGEDYGAIVVKGGSSETSTLNISGGIIEGTTGIMNSGSAIITITGGQIKASLYGIHDYYGFGASIKISASNDQPTILVASDRVDDYDGIYGIISEGKFTFESGKIEVNAPNRNATGVRNTSSKNAISISGGTISVAGGKTNVALSTYTRDNYATITGGLFQAKSTSDKAKSYGIDGNKITLGVNDSAISTTTPEVIGDTLAITGSQFQFYDGVLRGEKTFTADTIFSGLPTLTEPHTEASDEYTENTWVAALANFLEVNGTGYNNFSAAFSAVPNNGTINLIRNITLTTSIPTTPTNKSFTFDLNGNTMQYNSTITNRSTSLTIQDSGDPEDPTRVGQLIYNGTSYAIENDRTMYIKSGKIISRNNTTIYNYRQNSAYNNDLYIQGGTIQNNYSDYSHAINAGGRNTTYRSNVYLQGGEIRSGYNGITASYSNISITGGMIYARTGIYTTYYTATTVNAGDNEFMNAAETGVSLVQNSTFTLNSGILKGTGGGGYSWVTGIRNNNSTVTINGGKILIDCNYSASGIIGSFTMNDGEINVKGGTSDRYSVSAASALDNAASTRTIKGGIVKASATVSNEVYGINSGANDNNIIGTDDGEIHIDSPVIIGKKYGIYKGNLTFYDGILKGREAAFDSIASTTFAEDYAIKNGTESIDGYTYKTAYLALGGIVAKIGDAEYTKLASAVTAAVAGDVIDLVDNSPYTLTVPSDKDITIKLNGFSLAASGKITNSGKLTINNNTGSTANEFNYENSDYFITNNEGAELTLINTRFDLKNGIDNKGSLTLKGIRMTARGIGILNTGTVTTVSASNISNTIIGQTTSECYDQDECGNVIYNNGGTATFTGATLTNGFINNMSGEINFINSTVSKSGDGSSEFIKNNGTLNINNSTVSLRNNMGNTNCSYYCTYTPHAIENYGTIDITNNSTVQYTTTGYNTSWRIDLYADTISNEYGTINVSNSTIKSINDTYNESWAHTALANTKNGTINFENSSASTEVVAGYGTGIQSSGNLTITSGTVNVKSTSSDSDLVGVAGNGIITLGVKEDPSSPNYGLDTADVSTESPLISVSGGNEAYGVTSSNLYYYDGKVIAKTKALSNAPTGVEYLYEPIEYTDESLGYNYVILEWMRTQP